MADDAPTADSTPDSGDPMASNPNTDSLAAAPRPSDDPIASSPATDASTQPAGDTVDLSQQSATTANGISEDPHGTDPDPTAETATSTPSPDANGDSATTQTSDILPDDAAPNSTGDSAPTKIADEPASDLATDQDAPLPTTFFDAEGQPIYGLFADDLKVEFDDYFLFVDHFGSVTGQSGYDPRFDLSDFFLFADSFGKEAVLK